LAKHENKVSLLLFQFYLHFQQTFVFVLRLASEDDEGNLFKVPFSNGIACCLMLNGNLLVYNVKEKTFVEVDENDGVQHSPKY
jgi:hypothetical protein